MCALLDLDLGDSDGADLARALLARRPTSRRVLQRRRSSAMLVRARARRPGVREAGRARGGRRVGPRARTPGASRAKWYAEMRSPMSVPPYARTPFSAPAAPATTISGNQVLFARVSRARRRGRRPLRQLPIALRLRRWSPRREASRRTPPPRDETARCGTRAGCGTSSRSPRGRPPRPAAAQALCPIARCSAGSSPCFSESCTVGISASGYASSAARRSRVVEASLRVRRALEARPIEELPHARCDLRVPGRRPGDLVGLRREQP